MKRSPLETALEAWRVTHHPGFATIVEALSARELERPLVGTSNKKADTAAWLAIEKAGDPDDMPRLVATIAGGNSTLAAERVRILAARYDPRLVNGLLALAAEPPYTAGTSKKFWQALVAALEASEDVRARDGMLSLSRRYKTINDTNMGAWVAGAMGKATAKMREPAPLGTEDAATLASLEQEVLGAVGATAPKAVPAGAREAASLEELFAAIIAAPDDDAARLVYADLLTEQGDERGEFIMLQVDRAAGRGTPERADLERTKFVESKRVAQWAPPISTAAADVVFERGFPKVVRLDKTGLGHVADAVEWGTVTVLEQVAFAPAKAVQQFLDGGRAKNVTDASALPPRWIDKLKTASFPWTRVSFINDKLEAAHVERFPNLTKLEITRVGPLTPAIFAAAPNATSITLDSVEAAHSADLFAQNPKLEHLDLSWDAVADRFAGLGLRSLRVRADATAAIAWLRALPNVRTLSIHLRAITWPALRELFEQHASLEKLSYTFAHGVAGAVLERTPSGRLVLIAPPGPRWGRYYHELARAAEALGSIVDKVIITPSKPRHLEPPTSEADLAIVRAAWPNVEVREVL